MLNFSELNILLEEALSLDEKIMTKKQAARKRRLKAERRKAKQAELEKQKQEPIEPEIVEPEESTGTALVVYEQPQERQEHTEEFNAFMEALVQVCTLYSEKFEKGINLWKNAGKDKPCPPEAQQLLKEAIEELTNKTNTLTSQELPKLQNIEPEELQYLEIIFTGLDKYIDKQSKQIYAIKPEEIIDDDDVIDAEIVDDKQLPANTEQPDQPQNNKKLDDTKRTKENIITYEGWMKANNPIIDKAWKPISENLRKIKELPWGDFIKNIGKGALGFFEGSIWNFITSPLAKDIIKTLMYSNPLTAMIYDGDFGKIGLGDSISKLHDRVQKATQAKNSEAKRDKKGLPTEIKDLNFKKLKKEYNGNRSLVDLINLAYNHVDVDKKDKAILLQETKFLNKVFKQDKGERDNIVKHFTKLLETLNKICDYMEWTSEGIINQAKAKVNKVLGNKGNTEKEKAEIEGKVKEEEPEQQSLSDSDLNKLADLIVKKQKGESYQEEIKELITLLEAAEA